MGWMDPRRLKRVRLVPLSRERSVWSHRGERVAETEKLTRLYSLVVPRVFFSFSIVVTATARRIATDVHPTILVR